MNIKECYERMGADYGDVIRRLGSESLVEKFTQLFLEDESFNVLREGMERGDVKAAFRGAHTLKGVCANLGYSSLYEVSARLTEELRTGTLDGTEVSYGEVKKEYARTVGVIREWQGVSQR